MPALQAANGGMVDMEGIRQEAVVIALTEAAVVQVMAEMVVTGEWGDVD